MTISKNERELLHDILPFFHIRAHVVLRCLRQLSGLSTGEHATDVQVDDMARQIMAALDQTGCWWRVEEPVWLSRYWRPRGDLIVWVQHLRMECGESPEVFAPAPGKPGDPLWERTSRWMAAALEEYLFEEGIPLPCHRMIKARLRQEICDKYSVPSMRHLPGSICQREVIDLLLRCQLDGPHEVLGLEEIKSQLLEAV